MWQYDSGGKERDFNKYKENYDRIFGNKEKCEECGFKRIDGHDKKCSKHWKNK